MSGSGLSRCYLSIGYCDLPADREAVAWSFIVTGFDFAPTKPPSNKFASPLCFWPGRKSAVDCSHLILGAPHHSLHPTDKTLAESPSGFRRENTRPSILCGGIPSKGQEGLEPVILGMTDILNIDPGSDIANKSTDHQNENSLQQMALAAALPLGARSTINPIAAPAGKQKSR